MLIKTVIRKKRLNLIVDQQALVQLHGMREQCVAELNSQRVRATSDKSYFGDQLAPHRELYIDQLTRARERLAETGRRVAEWEARLHQQDEAIAELENRIAHANKELEKLEELAQEKLRDERTQQQQVDWMLLDEWVINRRGTRA